MIELQFFYLLIFEDNNLKMKNKSQRVLVNYSQATAIPKQMQTLYAE
jgi:hypothetical protein